MFVPLICDQEHVHKNLAKVAANAQGGGACIPSSCSLLSSGAGGGCSSSSTSIPLQPSSISNLNREASSDAPKNLMTKLQGIRSSYNMATSSSDTNLTPRLASSEDPSKGLSRPASCMPASSTSVPALSASGGAVLEPEIVKNGSESEDVSSLRTSQSVLSLQERLARLRA